MDSVVFTALEPNLRVCMGEGRSAHFRNYMYTTADPAMITELRKWCAKGELLNELQVSQEDLARAHDPAAALRAENVKLKAEVEAAKKRTKK